jgi:hypothetical protein
VLGKACTLCCLEMKEKDFTCDLSIVPATNRVGSPINFSRLINRKGDRN